MRIKSDTAINKIGSCSPKKYFSLAFFEAQHHISHKVNDTVNFFKNKSENEKIMNDKKRKEEEKYANSIMLHSLMCSA